MNEILQFLPNTTVQLKTETEHFVLINIHKKSGKSCLDKLFSKHENRLQQMYAFGFQDKSYYLHVQNDKKTKYVCVVFSLIDMEPVFYMTIRKYKLKHWSLYDICKQEGYTKGMFSRALNFCFSTLSPTVYDFYLAVDMDNCHLCTALCAYINSGFLPYNIEHHGTESYIDMKYDKQSCHLRNPLIF